MTEPYRVLVTRRFEKDLKKLPVHVQKRILNVLSLLAENPYAFEVLSGEFKGLRKVRVGDYRVIYRIDLADQEKFVRLLFVAHKRSVCR